MSKTSLSFVLLVGDAVGPLPALVAECLAIAARHTSDYELIIVVDGGDDATRQQATDLAATHTPVVAILNRRRLGFRQSLREGLRVARGAAVLALDPSQVPPGELPKLLALADRAAVFGARHPLPHSPGAIVARLAARGADRSLRDIALRLVLIRADLQGLIQADGPDDLVTSEIAAGARSRGLAVAQVNVTARHDGGAGERQRAALGLGAALVAAFLWALRRWPPANRR